jgi:hypothetical protein
MRLKSNLERGKIFPLSFFDILIRRRNNNMIILQNSNDDVTIETCTYNTDCQDCWDCDNCGGSQTH